ncbi:protein of unknown function [Streptomyces sp. KY75]|nr:protein of unknown function [Streptomyces sp. KY75]
MGGLRHGCDPLFVHVADVLPCD